VDDNGRFPSLVVLFLRHGGSLETVEELIRGVKARADQEMENWCPDRIRIRASTDPSEPNIFLDDRKEVEKWEHIEELRLWMKHTVGLLSDVVNNELGPAYFVSISQSFNLYRTFVLCFNCSIAGSQDLKETSRIKSSFIHATRGSWEQLPILKDQLLELQEKLLKAYKDLLALEEEKKEREAALVEAREASRKAVEDAVLLRERAMTVEEAESEAREEALSYKNAVADLDKEKWLLKTDMDSIRESFQRMKVECVNSGIARCAVEEAKKKALKDLEAERARSQSLSDDVDRLKRALLEKEGAIAQPTRRSRICASPTPRWRAPSGRSRGPTPIWLARTRLWRRASVVCFYYRVYFLRCAGCYLISSCWSLQDSKMSCWPPKSRLAPSRPSSRGKSP